MQLNKNNIETLYYIKEFVNKYKIRIFLLFGDIGSGKTTFVRNFLNNSDVTSPTYTLCHQYDNIFHYDLYRIDCNLENLENIGLLNAIQNYTVFIEWSEKLDLSIIKTYKNETIKLFFCGNFINIITIDEF